MSTREQPSTYSWMVIPLLTLLLILGILTLTAGFLALQSGWGASLLQTASALLALDSVHVFWYITRAAGLMGYLLFWLSTIWGFALGSKIFDSFLARPFTYDFHEQLSLLSLGFILLHMLVLLLDKVQPISLVGLLIPFAAAYRPFWTGIGILAFYLALLVTGTFYLRSKISVKAFRTIHMLSIPAYFAALLHGIAAGTDAGVPWIQGMYAGTTLITVFFFVHWVGHSLLQRRLRAKPQ